MSTIAYKDIVILSPPPTGSGGALIQNNFVHLADRPQLPANPSTPSYLKNTAGTLSWATPAGGGGSITLPQGSGILGEDSQGNLVIVDFTALPTSDPLTVGSLFLDGQTLKVSLGSLVISGTVGVIQVGAANIHEDQHSPSFTSATAGYWSLTNGSYTNINGGASMQDVQTAVDFMYGSGVVTVTDYTSYWDWTFTDTTGHALVQLGVTHLEEPATAPSFSSWSGGAYYSMAITGDSNATGGGFDINHGSPNWYTAGGTFAYNLDAAGLQSAINSDSTLAANGISCVSVTGSGSLNDGSTLTIWWATTCPYFDMGTATEYITDGSYSSSNTAGSAPTCTYTASTDATDGYFTGTYQGTTSGAIAYDASLATIATAIGLTVDTGTLVAATACPASDLTTMTVGNGTLRAWSGGNTVTRIAGGAAGANAQQSVYIVMSTGGTFTLTLDTQTTGNITFGANAGAVQTALEALSNVGSGNVSVTGAGTYASPYTIEFIGTLAFTAITTMTIDTSSLT